MYLRSVLDADVAGISISNDPKSVTREIKVAITRLPAKINYFDDYATSRARSWKVVRRANSSNAVPPTTSSASLPQIVPDSSHHRFVLISITSRL